MLTTCTSVMVTIIVLAFAAGSVVAFYAERKIIQKISILGSSQLGYFVGTLYREQ